MVYLDIVGGQNSLSTIDGSPKSILTMIDSFSGWAEAVPLPDQTAESVARAFFQHWIARYGVPEQVHSDQGSQFESELFRCLCEFLGVHKTRTTPYRPMANGKVERFNGTLVSMLRKALQDNPGPWE